MNTKSFINKAVRLMLALAAMAFFWSALGLTAFAEEYIHGYFRYSVSDNSVTITLYTGKEKEVTVPNMIAGDPVNTIAKGAFVNCEEVETIYLPDTIMTIEEGALPVGVTVVYNSNLGETKEAQDAKEDKEPQETKAAEETKETQDAKEDKDPQETKASEESGGERQQGTGGAKDDNGDLVTTGSESVTGETYGVEEIEIDFGETKEEAPEKVTEEQETKSQTKEQEADGEAEQQGSEVITVTLPEDNEASEGGASPVVFLVVCVLALVVCGAGFVLWKKRKS